MPDLELFTPGRYRAVRIPAIAVVGPRTIVAMAVGRRRLTDFGPSDLLIRRSTDGGESWGRTRVLVRGWWRTVDNPTLVVDPVGDVLQLFFQTDYRRLWQCTSSDGGRTFGPRIDLSRVVRAASTPDFRVDRFAPGPGSGAVLSGGRLVVPVWANQGRGQRPSIVLTIVSDDHGRSWQPGEIIAGPGGEFPNPTEASVAPTVDGGAVLSFRQATVPHRVFSWSPDGATRWSPPRAVRELYEPVCQAPLVALGSGSGHLVAFTHPDSRESATLLPGGKGPRENLTLRWSRDGGRTWGPAQVIDPGPSGYSALAPDPVGSLHILWERGRLPGTALWPTSIAYANHDREEMTT
jgi:sialidase-1